MKSKNKFSFLCIDDDPDLASVCAAMQLNTPVSLTPETPPATWESAIDNLTERLTKRRFDGLLLDFRLDEYPVGANNAKVRYTAESLVNELRRRSVEGSDRSYPIILWSTAENLSWYFSINPSYTGLYDGIWDKAVARQDTLVHGARLASLANGYRELQVAAKKEKPLHAVLNCDATAVLAEMEQAFTAKIKQAHFAFNYATFIINRILRLNGVLIDAPTVAAILGVAEYGAIGPLIKKLASATKPIRYSGVFADWDERFWREELVTQLNALVPGGRWLHLTASARVNVLKKALRIKKLQPAAPIHSTYQTDFDCVCDQSHRPLARANGYRLHGNSQDPWIQPRYIAGTIYRTMPQSVSKKVRLDVGEQERFAADFAK